MFVLWQVCFQDEHIAFGHATVAQKKSLFERFPGSLEAPLKLNCFFKSSLHVHQRMWLVVLEHSR